MIVAGLPCHFAADQIARRLEIHQRNQRLHERGVHPLADAGALALQERHQDAERQIDARPAVRNRDADARRLRARHAGDRHQAAHACAI